MIVACIGRYILCDRLIALIRITSHSSVTNWKDITVAPRWVSRVFLGPSKHRQLGAITVLFPLCVGFLCVTAFSSPFLFRPLGDVWLSNP